ncbi:MAG: hypothetical protein Q4P05_01530 [Actinomycetaceae bacterium]|nr:hypothetical protein [Actinomycetaceae bacterium]
MSYPSPAVAPAVKKPTNALYITVTVVLVLVIAVLSYVLYGLTIGHKATFSYGVVKVDERPLSDQSLVLSSALSADGTRVHNLIVRVKDTNASYSVETLSLDSDNTEKAPVITQIDVADTRKPLSNPRHTLVEHLESYAHISTVGASEQQVTFADRDFTWDESAHQWFCDTAGFEADVLYGIVDNLVIGTQHAPDFAGRADGYSIPAAEVTAFDLQTGNPVWAYPLDNPGYVSIAANTIAVSEVPATIDIAAAQVFENEEYISYLEAVAAEANGQSLYRLAPSHTDLTSTEQAVSTLDVPQFLPINRHAIRDFDFRNATYALHDQFDGLTELTLTDGEMFLTQAPPDEDWVILYPESPRATLRDFDNPDSYYGDFNQDGYEDLIVPLMHSTSVYGGNGWLVEFVVFVWDPAKGEPRQLEHPAFVSERCGARHSDIDIQPNGEIFAVATTEGPNDVCAIGWTVPHDVRYEFDAATETFVEHPR